MKKVDGVDVFPKLPVYLRTYYATWTRNQAAKNAVEQAKPATALLQQVIEKTRPTSTAMSRRREAAASRRRPRPSSTS